MYTVYIVSYFSFPLNKPFLYPKYILYLLITNTLRVHSEDLQMFLIIYFSELIFQEMNLLTPYKWLTTMAQVTLHFIKCTCLITDTSVSVEVTCLYLYSIYKINCIFINYLPSELTIYY